MINIRKADERGFADHGWLKARHTFSFAGYRDPQHMGFRALRVMNEDRVQPGRGFGTHPHQDMEIVTYVLEGAIEHKDNMGNGEVLWPGEFQHMSAGTGITHSEFNPSSDKPLHLYQIWLKPREKGITPSYDQKRFDDAGMTNRLRLVASPDGADGSLVIQQDTQIFLSKLGQSQRVTHNIASERYAWLQVLRGSVTLNGLDLQTGDGAAVSEEQQLEIVAATDAEIMLFDLN
ncbi:Quercetin 2,3-dioxygenase [Symmachiella dynata]|uniref:pirin family protein n=1 Tax=Symmachiella dynata TaxID=2527995 RepID=UPI001189464F|nr:pirin family protein [Symmachiella dynata]QDT51752.1 Quercetin 2,3-dioxygenase [Symmachiella dynata]